MSGCSPSACATCAWYEIEKKIKEDIEKGEKAEASKAKAKKD